MGIRYTRLTEAILTTHNLCFEKKYENYHIFLSEKFPFLAVKFSAYLNRRVCVMQEQNYKLQRKKTAYVRACERNEDSNKSAHPHSLISVLIICIKNLYILGYPKCVQRRF